MSCKTMSIDLANVPPVPIQIGVAGENAFRTITFVASTWGADFPDATYTVVYKRSDGYMYPVLVNAAADAIVWSPTDTDTAVSGNGQIEVRLLDGETIGKTIVMQTFVAPSLSGDESEPSTPAPDWVNDVAADSDRAEAAVSHYPKIVNGVWFVWDATQSEFVSTGINAQGEDGVSPTVTVTEIEGGHRVTITDADGAHTFDVLDGVGGSDAVESVNGKTGVVVLDATDVHALPDSTVIPVVPQMATAADMSDWTSGKTVDAAVLKEDFTAAALELNDLSVNKADRTDIPTAVSELTNDSGFVTAQQAAAAAPVQSVNGMTGAVTIPTGSSDAVLYTPQTLTAAQQEQARGNIGAGTYSKPNGGIPDSDIASAATWNAKGTYSKPSGGIPKTDLAQAVQTSLGKADTALQQHQSLAGYATETWVQNRGYQTAAEVQTAIAGKADASSVYTKTEVDQKLVGAMDYKGTKATVSELPTSGNATGDVWHIDADGSEWAWNGSAWEELGTAVDLSGYATEQWVENKGYLTQHQSLAAYRTASAQDAIDTAQNTAIAAKYTKPSSGIPDSDIASAATWNAKGTYSKPSGGIPKSDLAAAVQTSLGKADTALQSAPVTSVNNKTGTVTLSASDVGALPSSTSIPTKVSDLTNDSGFQTAPFEIEVTQSGSTYSTTASAADILAHQDNCVAVLYGTKVSLSAVTGNEYMAELFFTNLAVNEGAGYTMAQQIYISVNNGVVTVLADMMVLEDIPSVTSADDGKFLRVVSGAWAAETVQTWQGGSY